MSYNGPAKSSSGRTLDPDPHWRAKCAAARENDAPDPPGVEAFVGLLWAQGFGPVAAARMLDWYCSAHPETIARTGRENHGRGNQGKP